MIRDEFEHILLSTFWYCGETILVHNDIKVTLSKYGVVCSLVGFLDFKRLWIYNSSLVINGILGIIKRFIVCFKANVISFRLGYMYKGNGPQIVVCVLFVYDYLGN
jgi:hypothetical protein